MFHFRLVSLVALPLLVAIWVAGCAPGGDGGAAPVAPTSGAAQGAQVARSDAAAVYKSRLVRAGKQAPAFSLKQLGGGRVSLADLRGQVVVLSFWTASCPPCHLEAPHLQRLHEKYRERGVRFVGVTPLTPLEEMRGFVTRYGLTYPVAVDPGEKVVSRYGLRGYPALVLLDRRGVVRWTHPGFQAGDERALERQILALK